MDKPASEYLVISEQAKERMQKGIEQNRKGDFIFSVVDEKGNAVKDASVRVKQKSHEFRFGANIFMLDEIEDEPSKNDIYKEKFASLFNMATLPFYWDSTEPEEGKTRYHKDAPKKYRRPAIDRCIEYCEKHGIEPREHALCYDLFFPDWVKDKSEDELKKLLEKRMQEISSRYADKIPTIEVTNEMLWETWKNDFYNNPDFVADCFKLTEKYFPNNELCINEYYGLWNGKARFVDTYYLYIENAILKGARIDAIGMQYHMFCKKEDYFGFTRKLYNFDHLYNIMDMYSNFGKPIEITEITVPAFSWEEEDELHQADILEQLYTLWFSHPKTTQIIYWNLVDGYAHGTTPGDMVNGENYYHGGLLRFDLSEKPAFKRLKKLFTETWHTDEKVSVVDGKASVRAFYGDYDIEITVGGKTTTKTLSLTKKGDKNITVSI